MGRPEPAGPAGTIVRGADAVARVYERMLVPNFPAEELVAVAELIAAAEDGSTTVRVVGTVEDPVAVAVTESFPGSAATLLAYFAARADQRGRGVGTALLSGLLAGVAADPEASVVLAEVEHPHHHGPDEAHGDPEARLRFYGRLGARILDLPYFQPPVSADAEAVYGMLLLVLDPPARLLRGDRLLPEAGVAEALESIMAEVDTGRFPVAAALEAARDPLGVRLLPVERLADAAVALPR